MKNQFIGLLLAALSLSAVAAQPAEVGKNCSRVGEYNIQDGDLLYCTASGTWKDMASAAQISLTVVVTKDGQTVENVTLMAVDGMSTTTSRTTSVSYLADATKRDDGRVDLATSEVALGFGVTMLPEVDDKGQITVKFTLSKAELDELKTVVGPSGLVVQAPRVRRSMQTGSFAVSPHGGGLTTSLGEYTVLVSAKKV